MDRVGWMLVGLLLTANFLGPALVEANEGRIGLKNSRVACEGISVWKEDRYRVFGRCSGLVYPYAERIDRYYLWTEPETGRSPQIIDNIELGHFDGTIDSSFTKVFITAEGEGSPREPSGLVIASGSIVPFDFKLEATPVAVTILRPTPTPTAAPAAAMSAGLRRFLVASAIVVGIVGAVVVALVILSRRS